VRSRAAALLRGSVLNPVVLARLVPKPVVPPRLPVWRPRAGRLVLVLRPPALLLKLLRAEARQQGQIPRAARLQRVQTVARATGLRPRPDLAVRTWVARLQ